MKIYKEFGEEQMSLFSSVQSDKFQNLPYTKLLALTALSSEERDNLSESVDIEKTSVKELEEKIKEIKSERDGFKDKSAVLEDKLSKAVQEAEKYQKEIETLKEQVAEAENQESVTADETIKAEYEEKLKKAENNG